MTEKVRMDKNNENWAFLSQIEVNYEIVNPKVSIRSCIHCSGQSCWCIMGKMDAAKETKK